MNYLQSLYFPFLNILLTITICHWLTAMAKINLRSPSHLQWLSVRNQWIGHFRVLAGYNNTCVIISGMEKAYSSLHLQSIDVTELSFLHHHHLSWFWKLMWIPLSLKKSNLQFLEAEKHVRTGVINLKTTASKSTRFYEIRLNPMASRYEL